MKTLEQQSEYSSMEKVAYTAGKLVGETSKKIFRVLDNFVNFGKIGRFERILAAIQQENLETKFSGIFQELAPRFQKLQTLNLGKIRLIALRHNGIYKIDGTTIEFTYSELERIGDYYTQLQLPELSEEFI